jgi:hypothetical protein
MWGGALQAVPVLRDSSEAGRKSAAVTKARKRAENYLLERRMFRSLRTGEVIDKRWLRFSFPTFWYYDVLRGLDYLRNPGAVSTKGAIGLMQLMPATAQHFGATHPFQIHENVRAGVVYLARLMRVVDGDLRLVTAAYAAGERPILSKRLHYSSDEVYR